MAKAGTSTSRSKKRKKIRYRKLVFKVSAQQKKQMDRYCKLKHITSVRMIRKALNEFLERHADEIPEEIIVSKNQLKLFELNEEHRPGTQTSLFSL
jgi:hypothetical protein